MPETNFSARGLTFDKDTHSYFWMGRPVPGVTSLLKEYRLIDFTGIPPERLEFKRMLGTAVDLACELLIERTLDHDTVSPVIKPYVDGFLKFCEVTGFEVRYPKQRLYSLVWGFAGEFDMAGSLTYKKRYYKNAMVDTKCVWAMYPSTGPQLAAYEILHTENYKDKVDARFGLQLKSNGTFELYPYTNPKDKNVFLSCVILDQFRREHKIL